MYIIKNATELLDDLYQQYEKVRSEKLRLESILERGEKYYSGKNGLKNDLAILIGKYYAYDHAIEMTLALKRTVDQQMLEVGESSPKSARTEGTHQVETRRYLDDVSDETLMIHFEAE